MPPIHFFCSCLNGLSELEHRYDLAGKFLEIESGFVYGEGGRGSPTLEGKKEELLLDIMDFNREFQVCFPDIEQ